MTIRSMEDLRRAVESVRGEQGLDAAKARKRRRIVEAATRLLLRHGYRKTSIDDVALEAGIAKGTVYLYFKNKAELLYAAVVTEKAAYLDRVRPLFDPGIDPRERLHRYVQMSVELAAEMPLTSKLMSGDREVLAALADMEPGKLRQSSSLGIEFLSDLIAGAAAPRALPAPELHELAQTVTALLLAAALTDERARFGLPLSRFGARLADLIVDGVAGKLAAPHEVTPWSAPPASPSRSSRPLPASQPAPRARSSRSAPRSPASRPPPPAPRRPRRRTSRAT